MPFEISHLKNMAIIIITYSLAILHLSPAG